MYMWIITLPAEDWLRGTLWAKLYKTDGLIRAGLSTIPTFVNKAAICRKGMEV